MNKPVLLDITEVKVVDEAPLVRKLLYLVLLTAIKDQAGKVLVDPLEEECRLMYEVEGQMYDMVPAPFPGRRITQAIKAILELDHAGSLVPCQGRMQVKIGDHVLAGTVQFQPTELGDQIAIQIFNPAPAARAAGDILEKYLAAMDHGEETNGEDV